MAVLSYIGLVVFVVVFEVGFQEILFGEWLYYIGSAIFALVVLWIQIRGMPSVTKALAMTVLIVSISIVIGVVVGTNVKLLLGGVI